MNWRVCSWRPASRTSQSKSRTTGICGRFDHPSLYRMAERTIAEGPTSSIRFNGKEMARPLPSPSAALTLAAACVQGPIYRRTGEASSLPLPIEEAIETVFPHRRPGNRKGAGPTWRNRMGAVTRSAAVRLAWKWRLPGRTRFTRRPSLSPLTGSSRANIRGGSLRSRHVIGSVLLNTVGQRLLLNKMQVARQDHAAGLNLAALGGLIPSGRGPNEAPIPIAVVNPASPAHRNCLKASMGVALSLCS